MMEKKCSGCASFIPQETSGWSTVQFESCKLRIRVTINHKVEFFPRCTRDSLKRPLTDLKS